MELKRNNPGTKAIDFYRWKDEVFEEMEGSLACQQYIQQNIRKDCHNVVKILEMPQSFEDKKNDILIWCYEHLRQFCIDFNQFYLYIRDQCTPNTCPQMSSIPDILYLCASHKIPKECPAIIYIKHSLDGASAFLTNTKFFPSRMNIKESLGPKLESTARRLYRIFGHVYFHHKKLFDDFEEKTSLCHRYTLFIIQYNLLPKVDLIVPIKDLESMPTTSNIENTMVLNGLNGMHEEQHLVNVQESQRIDENKDEEIDVKLSKASPKNNAFKNKTSVSPSKQNSFNTIQPSKKKSLGSLNSNSINGHALIAISTIMSATNSLIPSPLKTSTVTIKTKKSL